MTLAEDMERDEAQSEAEAQRLDKQASVIKIAAKYAISVIVILLLILVLQGCAATCWHPQIEVDCAVV